MKVVVMTGQRNTVATPIGEICIVAKDGFPCRIMLPGHESGVEPGDLSQTPALKRLMEAVSEYFEGREPHRGVVDDLILNIQASPFARKVLTEVISIPRGETVSYGEIAARVNRPGASRGVGAVMRANPYPLIIPCHRVVNSDGSPGGYSAGEKMKIWLLGFEGATIKLK